jgi:hypothetical protein
VEVVDYAQYQSYVDFVALGLRLQCCLALTPHLPSDSSGICLVCKPRRVACRFTLNSVGFLTILSFDSSELSRLIVQTEHISARI